MMRQKIAILPGIILSYSFLLDGIIKQPLFFFILDDLFKLTMNKKKKGKKIA